jgi:hypothetical protein
MNNPDLISVSLGIIFGVKILRFFDADPGSGLEKNSVPGLTSRIRNNWSHQSKMARNYGWTSYDHDEGKF